jgi:hypothetical protein
VHMKKSRIKKTSIIVSCAKVIEAFLFCRYKSLVDLALGVSVATLMMTANAHALYTPPIGIPAPPFGINETTPAQPTKWPSTPVAGFFYIDNTHASATDANNAYGCPNKPRQTIPNTFSAGSYVEIHGGPYSLSITCNGTAAQPVWITGTQKNRPIFQGLGIQGTYYIAQYLFFQELNGFGFLYPTSYACIRYCEFDGGGQYSSSNGSGIGFDGNSASERNTYMVVYNNKIHDLGQWNTNENADFHGIKPRYYCHYIWILQNQIYRCQGDSVQTGEANGTDFPRYVYIGGNKMSQNKENGVDIKHGLDIVVSQNKIFGMDAYGDSAGEGIIIHDSSDNVWVIANTIYQCKLGIVDTGGTNCWFLGNLIYNIDGSTDPNSLYGLGAAIHFRGTSSGGAVGNTIYNCDKGMQLAAGSNYFVVNNIFSKRSDPSSYDIMASSSLVNTIDYCLFNGPNDDGGRILWGSNSYSSVSAFRSGSNQCVNCPNEGSPLFSNPGYDFSLKPGSPAIDHGTKPKPVGYLEFENRYGIDISKDIYSYPRPQNTAWDIGAFEYGSAVALPSAPQNLRFLE